MNSYVSPSSKTPIKDAVSQIDSTGYQTGESGREFYFEANEDETSFRQIYTDNNEVIEWGGAVVGKVTPANTLEVSFSC